MVSVGCQTEPNLIDKLINNHTRKQLDDVDLYQEYVRDAQCAQFWPLDKNPIRSLVPSMLNVDLPEQHLKNESLMFDLVQAITNNSKLVDLLAKYIHHIVPNVIISKRIDLIPLITCTIRVCRDTSEQERLISLLFNLIKRPNEEQRRMILSGIIVVLQVSPQHSSSLLLPNLWDHVNDKFPERRILLVESCSTLAHYVRPIMRTNLLLSILIKLLKDKNLEVRSAACKSFACLLSLIMDRNDEVFDACLSATEDIIQDVLSQAPVNFCEHRFELEQMRFCALETVYPLLCMWAVKLNRFKVEMAELYLIKAERYIASLISNQNQLPLSFKSSIQQHSNNQPMDTSISIGNNLATPSLSPAVNNKPAANNMTSTPASNSWNNMMKSARTNAVAAAAVAKRRSIFFESRHSSWASSTSSGISSLSGASGGPISFNSSSASSLATATASSSSSSSSPTVTRAIGSYLKMLNYLIPFLFSDSVHSCAWLSKSQLSNNIAAAASSSSPSTGGMKFNNKLLEPRLIIDESAIVAFYDQLEQDHMVESIEWILNKFLPKYFSILTFFAHSTINTGATTTIIQEFLLTIISSIRQLCQLFGKHLTRTKIRPLIKEFIQDNNVPVLFFLHVASLTSFEPIEQQEYEEIVASIRQILNNQELTRNDVELLALSIKIIATNSEQIHSPSTRQKFLTYILDALVNYSNQTIRTSNSGNNLQINILKPRKSSFSSTTAPNTKAKQASVVMTNTNSNNNRTEQQQQTQAKEFMLIIFRHILTCLIDSSVRPPDWAHILVTKFLPLIILLANDWADVHICTYARLMCAQLVETFDTYLNSPELTKQMADSIMPALHSLKGLTEQIKASNLSRQIECLTQNLNEKFFSKQDESGVVDCSVDNANNCTMGDSCGHLENQTTAAESIPVDCNNNNNNNNNSAHQ